MARSESSSKAGCCHKEKRRLVEDLSNCGYCSTSFEDYQLCKQEATRESGERSRTCMIG